MTLLAQNVRYDSLRDAVVVVTGGASGIGGGMAERSDRILTQYHFARTRSGLPELAMTMHLFWVGQMRMGCALLRGCSARKAGLGLTCEPMRQRYRSIRAAILGAI